MSDVSFDVSLIATLCFTVLTSVNMKIANKTQWNQAQKENLSGNTCKY